MTIPHLVMLGADDYLANGDGDSLRMFETRVEDATGHVTADDREPLIEAIANELRPRTNVGGRLQVLLDFLDRQRRVVRGKL